MIDSNTLPAQNADGNTAEKWLHNLSNTIIPTNVQNILKLGNKFCPPIGKNHLPINNIICDVEAAFFQITDEDIKIEARNNLVNILTNYTKSKNSGSLSQNDLKTNRQLIETHKFLKSNPELLVMRADKGNITVIMEKKDYISKMNCLLQDQTTYTNIKKPTTEKIKRDLNVMVTQWYENKKIDEHTMKKLKNLHGNEQRMYGLPKVHKQDVPVRPIVSAIDSPLYEISAFLGNILKHSIGNNNISIKN